MSSLQATQLQATQLQATHATGSFRTQTFGRVPGPRAPESAELRRPLGHVRRVVVKLGTRVLVDESGAARLDRLEALARSVAALRAGGLEVLVVSSGAVGLGSGVLGLAGTQHDVDARRACAAVGQARLLSLYQSVFAVHGLITAQVLLTCADLSTERQDSLRATFERLLASGVVPVVNENDAVSLGVEIHESLKTLIGDRIFRDNDGLAALVAEGCDADLLLLLTDVDGVCARDPRLFPGEPALDQVDDAEALLAGLVEARQEAALASPCEGMSRGGMHSKVAAAQVATHGHCDVVIGSGNQSGAIEKMVAGDAVGTFFPKQEPIQQEPIQQKPIQQNQEIV